MQKGQIQERYFKKTDETVFELIIDFIDLGMLGISPVVEEFKTRAEAEKRKKKLKL